MKQLTTLLLLTMLVFSSCEGPMGLPGEDGTDGTDFIGVTFEFTGNFNTSNGYQLLFNFSENGYLPYESDVILTYILWTSENGLDYWRALPQNVYFESGAILQYNFDFTGDIEYNAIQDMAVFLEGDVDLSSLPSAYTQNQTFRVVVVPSDFLSTTVDVQNIESVLNAKNISFETKGSVDLR